MESFALSHFDDFLQIARQQTEPQKLLLVVAARELPQGHTQEQARAFAAGEGGHMAPIASVDRAAHQLANFTAFEAEAAQIVKKWDAVFVGALPGEKGNEPLEGAVDTAIEQMLHAIRNGMVNQYLIFNRQGEPITLVPA